MSEAEKAAAGYQPRARHASQLLMQGEVRIGTAGWTIPAQSAEAFPAQGSHLQRYAQRFNAVEINSSFYRPHKPATYAKWAASVPPNFRFAVKMPREITHTRKLEDFALPLDRFLTEIAALGDKLGPLLVQLPPSLRCEIDTAAQFFHELRARFAGGVVFEPRHPSWFDGRVDDLLLHFNVARVAADPARVAAAAEPGGWPGMVYLRLHGSPRMYYSAYSEEYLDRAALLIRQAAERQAESWCIFDNTAHGAACGNALSLMSRL
jgi:uncharacterized protein YecE (DUF72 family)